MFLQTRSVCFSLFIRINPFPFSFPVIRLQMQRRMLAGRWVRSTMLPAATFGASLQATGMKWFGAAFGPTSAVTSNNTCLPMNVFKRTTPLYIRVNKNDNAASASSGSSSSWLSSFSSGGQQQPTAYQGSTESTADAMTPHVRAHLARVYSLVAAGVGVAGAGSALMMLTPLGRTVPWFVPMFGGFIPLLWLMWAPPRSVEARMALFFSFAFLEGMTLAPLVKATMIKGVLGTSLVLTGCIFVGFSAAAYLSPRASMLKFQGPLYGMLIGMVAISLLNLIYPTAFAHSIVLYGGLALFSMFIAVDTQAMVERARCGGSDHVQDAVQMFLNVVNVFVRIAQIMRGD